MAVKTAAKEPTTAQRKLFAKMGLAMPDGSYYIRNGPVGASDLQNAIDSVGRGENAGDSGTAIRKHIMKRAAALKLSSKIPDTWKADGTLKDAEHSSMTVSELLEHHGVQGMHWGVHKGDVASAARGAKRETYKVAGKVVDTAIKHPIATVVAVRTGQVAYQHREEIKNTAIILAKIGAYGLKQATAKDSPINETLAIGRQVVQGYVVHSDEDLDAISHHGIKGMRWGVRNEESRAEEGSGGSGKSPEPKLSDHDRLIQKAENHEAVAKAHADAAKEYAKEAEEVREKGLDSAAGRRVYGDFASKQSAWEFYGKHNQTQGEALQQLHNNLRIIHNYHARASNSHNKKAQKLRNKAARLEHGGVEFKNFDIDVYFRHFGEARFNEGIAELRHHGVKGMHWGVRKPRGPASEDHIQVADLRSKVKEGRGVHVLSNDELKTVNDRLNLETNYQRLIDGSSSVTEGEKFVRDGLNKVKLGIDAVETGKKAVKLFNVA